MDSKYSTEQMAQFMDSYKALYECVRQLRCAPLKKDAWWFPIQGSNKYEKISIATTILTELIPKIPFEFWEHLDIDVSVLEKECSEIVESQLSAI